MHEELVKRLRSLANLVREYNEIGNLYDDAADAVEELNGYLAEAERDRDEYRERLDKTNDMVEKRWIPVTDKFPEDCTPVQVCYIGYYSKKIGSDMLACRHEGLWCYWDGDPCSYDPCQVEITHWMPLPEPPKEEEP